MGKVQLNLFCPEKKLLKTKSANLYVVVVSIKKIVSIGFMSGRLLLNCNLSSYTLIKMCLKTKAVAQVRSFIFETKMNLPFTIPFQQKKADWNIILIFRQRGVFLIGQVGIILVILMKTKNIPWCCWRSIIPRNNQKFDDCKSNS